MFGFGQKTDKKMLLRTYALGEAAKTLRDDLRTLQRAVDLIKNDGKVADILYAFVDNHVGAMGDPNEQADAAERQRRTHAADEARNKALLDLHVWFCEQIKELLPDDADPVYVGRIIAELVGMPFVETRHEAR